MPFQSLKNHLLIAMPGLHDGLFDRTVIVICEHTEEGAMGIVINRLLDLNLADALRAVDIVPGEEMINQAVYWGGPVQEQNGFILHTPAGAWQSSLAVSADLVLTTSPDLLTAIAQHEGPDRFLLALGYAGWGAGQLDTEIRDNAWLNVPSDDDLLFGEEIENKWERAIAKIGVDFSKLSANAGHA